LAQTGGLYKALKEAFPGIQFDGMHFHKKAFVLNSIVIAIYR